MIALGLPVAVSALVLGGCGGGAGSGDVGGGTYAIGFQAGLSGAETRFGINAANGIELAVEEFNSSPRAPFRLRLVKSDDGGVAEHGASAARRLIDNPDVVAVVGPAFSDAAAVSAPLYGEAGLAAVSPAVTGPRSVAAQGAGIASYAAEVLGLRHVAVVDDTTDYGEGLRKAVTTELGRAGVRVTLVSAPIGARDFRPVAAAVRASGADGLVFSGYRQDAVSVAKALRAAGVTVPVVTGEGVKEEEFVASAGDAAENWVSVCPCADAAVNPAAGAFVAAHRATFKTEPGAYAAEAYDVARMVIGVIARLDAQGSGVTRAAVAAELRRASYTGLTGTFSFDDYRGASDPGDAGAADAADVSGRDMHVYQVRAGRIEHLGRIGELVAR